MELLPLQKGNFKFMPQPAACSILFHNIIRGRHKNFWYFLVAQLIETIKIGY